MRKAVIDASLQVKEGSGRRYWVRANPPSAKADEGSVESVGKKKPKAKFLEPYRLGGERRAELTALLAAQGVGDDEGRALFASAIEYDIAAYRQSAPQARAKAAPPPPAPAPKPSPQPDPVWEAEVRIAGEILALGDMIATLTQTLGSLEPAVRERLAEQLKLTDPFRRDYAGEYLDVLGGELARLSEAARSVQMPAPRAEPEPEPPAPPAPPLSQGERRFLRRVAGVFEECLETKADPGGAFAPVLDLVAVEAGIVPPATPESLASILKGG